MLTVLLTSCLSSKVYRELLPQEPLPPTELASGLASLSAKDCGTCHVAIYDEWSESMMGQAWTDPVFQADFQERDELYVCRHCHTPLTEQQPELTVGIDRVLPSVKTSTVDNPHFQPELVDEGVTCVACHLQDGAIVGPHDKVDAPHAWRFEPEFATGATCERCHQMPRPPLWKLDRDIADTHRELEVWQAATGSSDDCVTCHMPAIDRPLMEGYPSRPGRQHTFAGSWDGDMLRSAVALSLEGEELLVENRAGHNLPTAEPTHVLELVWLAGDEVLETQRWARVIDRRKEVEDSTLSPNETRRVEVVEGATSVELRFLRLALMPEVVQAAIPDEQRTVVIASLPLR